MPPACRPPPGRASTTPAAARAHIRAQGAPIVVKADGLAAGKGVVVAATVAEAEAAIADIMEDRIHGAAGAAVVIEECLVGEEISFFALCDGDDRAAARRGAGPQAGRRGRHRPEHRRHGRLFARRPPSPTRCATQVMADVIRPTLAEMARRGTPFRGVLFAGLMLTATGPKLIEFNVRFGDPECQALMLRLRSDLLPALLAACDGELRDFDLRWDAAAEPGRGDGGRRLSRRATPRAREIRGLDRAAAVPGVQVFHAGTGAAGGWRGAAPMAAACSASRATGRDAARRRATRPMRAVDALDWPEGFCRRDIAHRAL